MCLSLIVSKDVSQMKVSIDAVRKVRPPTHPPTYFPLSISPSTHIPQPPQHLISTASFSFVGYTHPPTHPNPQAGKIAEVCLCYTGDVLTSSIYNLAYYKALAHECVAAGAHIIGIKV